MTTLSVAGPVWMVDDESELVAATVGMLTRELGDRVFGSTDPREVATWIERERPGALITDVRMPHLNGLELVTKLHQRWGAVPVVVMTAFPTAQVDQEARAGSFVYLPKPFAFQSLREALKKVCRQPAPATFSGAIAVSMLSEVVQLYGLANRSGTLQVDSPEGTGTIAFEAGRVVHAQAPSARGVDAFNIILAWDSGHFSWHDTRASESSIHQGLSELLIDAYRLRDERQRGVASRPSSHSVPIDCDDEAIFAELDRATDMPSPVLGNVMTNLNRLERADGFLGAALFDIEANACLASVDHGSTVGVEAAVGAHVDVLQANRRTIARLDLSDEVEDIVISLTGEYHLLRLVRRQPSLFFFLTLDRERANLAMARYLLSDVERDIVL